jgi:glycosyltransferase involved in cell wall biosynthesis
MSVITASWPDDPLISVVMPVFNGRDYLAEAIESVLAQTYPCFELIIVDDGSSDGSVDVIRLFAARDARIRPIYSSHRGAGGAANVGIQAAGGDFIARMDADDISLPERLATQLAWICRTGVDICGSCAKVFGDEDHLLWFPETHQAIQKELLFRNSLLQGAVMMRASIAKANPYHEQLYFEDYELWTRLLSSFRTSNIQQVLLKYRYHAQQRHLKHAAAVRNELRENGERYFRSMFPDSSKEDATVIGYVRDGKPVASLGELELAGAWLVRLARGDDKYLRFRMAQRWWSLCRKSAYLGMGCYQRYQQINTDLGFGTRRQRIIIFMLCLLRVPEGSQLETVLRWVRRRVVKLP